MALIVETGAGDDPTANTYVTRADAIAFAALRGVTLDDADTTDVFLIKAMDYMELLNWAGVPTHETQPLAWPRDEISVNCKAIDADAIPPAVKKAQMLLAIYAYQGVPLDIVVSTATPEPFVTKEQIGPIVTEYSEAVQMSAPETNWLPSIDKLLGAYLKPFGANRSYRV